MGNITRRDFLRKSTMGILSLAVVGKFGLNVDAATVSDNLTTGTYHSGASAPKDKSILWIDTSNGGTAKYWNGSAWKPIRTTWDE